MEDCIICGFLYGVERLVYSQRDKATSVNDEPISFSLGVSDTQILCELKCCALFLIMETW